MAALRSLKDERKRGAGAYTITGKGIESSALNLGAAILKAQSIASRLQRELKDEEVLSIYIRKLGQETVVRVDIRRDSVMTFTL